MAITISGENNNDRILAQDGVIDQISGINIVGVLTATSFVGDVTGNVTGNLTGNVNSTSPLLLQTGGSERFRITGNNELGIAGANYGSSGQVLTSGGSGSAVSWTTIPTQVTIANNADNRVITGGSGTNLNGEANLSFNGTNVKIGSGTPAIAVGSGLEIDSGGAATVRLEDSGSTSSFEIQNTGGVIKQNMYNSQPWTVAYAGNEKFRIDSSGRVLIGRTSAYAHADADNLIVGNEATNEHQGITILSHSSKYGGIYFGDGAGTNPNNRCKIIYDHPNDQLRIGTGGAAATQFYINSSGYVGINQSPSTRLDVKQDNGVAYNNRAQTIAYNAARFLNTSGHTSGGTYTGFQFNITGDSQNRICSIGMITEASNNRYSSLVFATDDGGNRIEKLRITSGGDHLFLGGTLRIKDATNSTQRGAIYGDSGAFYINAGANLKLYSGGGERFVLDNNGNIAHTSAGSGISYFTGSSEYIFGSTNSSPPAGGNEANVQIHASKTRAQFSINAYMSGNAGGPFMQFLSSRSGTVGTLGGKVNSNDYLGEIRFSGDNGTNYNSVAHGATIWARAKSTPGDGDTTIKGELNFNVGSTDGTAGVKNRLTIQHNGRIKFIEDDVQRNSGAKDNFSGDGAYMQHYVSRDGSTYRRNFDIASVGDGSWGSSIRFSTNPDSNSTTSEAMRINHLQQVKIGGTYSDTTHKLLVDNGSCDFKGRVYVRESLSFYSTPFGANVTYDTGISVNAGGYGGSILAICSRNYGAGTNTQSGLYLIKFHYDGNNTPQIIHIAGTNMATFGKSGSNTLTVAMGPSNNMFTAIESSVG